VSVSAIASPMKRRTGLRSSGVLWRFTRDYPERVIYSFRPQPKAEEHEALVLALERLLEEQPSPYRSEWRRVAIEEGVSADDEDESQV
jgi:hypothetical protein